MLHITGSWQDGLIIVFIIISLGMIAGKLTEKPKIPDVAAFLVLGILLGPQVFHLIDAPSQSSVNQFILYLGATLILFDGGRAVRFDVLRQVYISISILVTIGVLISAVIVAIAVHYFLGASWIWSLLLGGIISSTDPATLIPVFKRVPILARLQQTMETESAFNDATASVLVFTLMAAVQTGGSLHIGPAVLSFFHSSLLGILVGGLFGLIAVWIVSPKGWGILHEYASVVMFVAAIGSYVVSSGIGASGFMAAFSAGVMVGNAKSFGWAFRDITNVHVDHFGNVMTTIVRMLIFVLLGTQVDFHVVYQYLWVGLGIVAVLMFVARPISVLGSVTIDRRAKWSRRETTFMMWVRETGVIPAALAGTAVANRVQGANIIVAITFLAILSTILVQATTTGTVAKWLKLNREFEESEL